MLEDLHEVVKHLQEVYHVQKIILLGHSFGSVLGSLYTLQYPENVMAYIGAGQVINMMENERECYLLAMENAQKAGSQKQIRKLEKLEGYPPKDKELLMKQLPKVRQVSMKNSKNTSELSAGALHIRRVGLYHPGIYDTEVFCRNRGTTEIECCCVWCRS